ncbi:hypothetical protein [Bifidobacterium hapali]|uniref:hypothetical protein n=1 Tax=Bifidobacterium hapali TaxID=1630172 RepID=UPI00117820D1|nr:hypothetical protein [Bifidobacterium hapali]
MREIVIEKAGNVATNEEAEGEQDFFGSGTFPARVEMKVQCWLRAAAYIAAALRSAQPESAPRFPERLIVDQPFTAPPSALQLRTRLRRDSMLAPRLALYWRAATLGAAGKRTALS